MKNVGKLDRMVRIVLGFAFLYLGSMDAGLMMLVYYLLALVMLYTAFTMTCPMYEVLGMKPKAGKAAPKAAVAKKKSRPKPKKKKKR